MNWDTKYILFTGAGFTANIGAPLASEMWYSIFNHPSVQSEKRIKDLMLSRSDFDYESIYHSVTEGDFTLQEKEAISVAVFSAYEDLDLIVREWIYRDDIRFPLNIYHVSLKLIDLFQVNNQPEKGFFFTINQDLFIERKHKGKHLEIPGVESKVRRFSRPNKPLEEDDYCVVPEKKDIEKDKAQWLARANFFYIKLHGSQDWISSIGKRQLVIGGGKEKQIKKIPILSWYVEIFKKTLFKENRRLLIIGYGFRDKHINKIISKAVEDTGLKVYVISPQYIEDFKNNLKIENYGADILNGLSCYYRCSLLDMFYRDEISIEYKNLIRNFFGIRK